MDFRTKVEITRPPFSIEQSDKLLFVGSCFAQNIGGRFKEDRFVADVNPYGVMYNPASVLHTVDRYIKEGNNPAVVFITLGTNHVYILKETGEIVDNCMKRPQKLFEEKELTIDECKIYLKKTIEILKENNADVKVVVTVSPIRYAKYGYHNSQLSKATLLLSVNKLTEEDSQVKYFPAYEIVMDELRDYRFYNPDMLHPSQQAVEYIWEVFTEKYLSEGAKLYLKEWLPIKSALNHKPFNPDSEEYIAFMERTKRMIDSLKSKYKYFAL